MMKFSARYFTFQLCTIDTLIRQWSSMVASVPNLTSRWFLNQERSMCSTNKAPKCVTREKSTFPTHSPPHLRYVSTPPKPSLKMPGENAVLRFVKLTEKAHAPTKGSELAAGFDLKSAYEYVIPARGKELVKTDLQIQLPEGCYGRIAPRSGLAWKNFIDVGAGVIDADYTGNVGIVMFNHGAEDFSIQPGDRVAQLVCERICYPDLQEVKIISSTARGDGGFGSTGKH